MAMAHKVHVGGLARRLVLEQILDETTVIKALEKSKSTKTSFVIYLVQNKLLDSATIAYTASANFGLPLFDLDAFNLALLPKDLLKPDLVQRHHVLPLYKSGDKLFVAVSDPTNQVALDEIKFYTGLHTHSILVEEDKLNKVIEKILSEQASSIVGEMQAADLDSELTLDNSKEAKAGTDLASEALDAPIVRFVHKILLDAIHQGASDIHFEPYEKDYRVRFRVDGILYEIVSPPITLAYRIAARIKVMSRLDISERRLPQDGGFKINLSANRAIDFRVSTCPTVSGEKVVIRILDPTTANIGIEALGFAANQQETFLKYIHQPQGMVLVTGPTGSGKTVTLYTALNILNQPDVNISTVEDPVEIHVQGINQVNINVKAGLSFASVLRAFLRQDPDIMMIGEMRDLETAEIAVKAAQTGHRVLSTLHTNSAAETLTRLAYMGLPLYNIATSVSLIIAQRLTRKLCTQCKEPLNVPSEVLIQEGFQENELSSLTIYGPVGCEYCTNGYKGREGLYELLPVTTEISRLILKGVSALELLNTAHGLGMKTLRDSGLIKVRQGLTSLDEINRVTKD